MLCGEFDLRHSDLGNRITAQYSGVRPVRVQKIGGVDTEAERDRQADHEQLATLREQPTDHQRRSNPYDGGEDPVDGPLVGLPSRLHGENADCDRGGPGVVELQPERRVQRHHQGGPGPQRKAPSREREPRDGHARARALRIVLWPITHLRHGYLGFTSGHIHFPVFQRPVFTICVDLIYPDVIPRYVIAMVDLLYDQAQEFLTGVIRVQRTLANTTSPPPADLDLCPKHWGAADGTTKGRQIYWTMVSPILWDWSARRAAFTTASPSGLGPLGNFTDHERCRLSPFTNSRPLI